MGEETTQTLEQDEFEDMFEDDMPDADDMPGTDGETENENGETKDGEPENAEEKTDDTAEKGKPGADEAGAEKGEAKEPKYKVKYNGREIELPLSELVINAQKGMNYDHVVKERDDLRASPENKLLDDFAKASGMKKAEYIKFLQTSIREKAIEDMVSKGVPEETAAELYDLKQKDAARKATETETAARREAEEKAQEERLEGLREFAAVFPDVKKFPDEVLKSIAGGMRPLAAYLAYENKRLSSELSAEKKNKDNKERAAGSVKDGAAAAKKDPFLDGWDDE